MTEECHQRTTLDDLYHLLLKTVYSHSNSNSNNSNNANNNNNNLYRQVYITTTTKIVIIIIITSSWPPPPPPSSLIAPFSPHLHTALGIQPPLVHCHAICHYSWYSPTHSLLNSVLPWHQWLWWFELSKNHKNIIEAIPSETLHNHIHGR